MLLTIVVFLIILSILVLGHEAGHYLMAKKTGVKVEEFGFGYPPRLFGKKIGETIYSINWLPFGGFVRLLGEDGPDRKLTEEEKKRAFFAKSKKVRAAILVSGVLVNVLIGIIAFTIIYAKTGIPQKTGEVRILEVMEESPAKEAGIQTDDMVIVAGGQEIKTSQKFIEIVAGKAGEEIGLRIKRGEEEMETAIVPRKEPPEDQGPLGVVISDTEMKFYPLWQMPFYAAWHGSKEALGWSVMTALAVKEMILARSGLLQTVQFLGVLSINLAVLNILPIPALDGGRLVFIGFEAVFGRRIRPKVERWLHIAGFAVIITLLIMVTINDILRILEPLGIFQKIRGLF
jgi:regulator of sigma E protease